MFTNDKFFPKGELNESPIFDDSLWKDYERSSDISHVNPNLSTRDDIGVVINKNDLSFSYYLSEKNINFEGCIFHDPEYQPTKSASVREFETGLIEQLCLKFPDYYLCQTKEPLINWARNKKLKCLIFPFKKNISALLSRNKLI